MPIVNDRKISNPDYVSYLKRSGIITKLPDDLTTIGSYMFYQHAGLSCTELPSGITGAIGNYAFQNCTSLALATLPSGVTIVGNYAFDGCASLALTTLPSNVTAIGTLAFQFSGITNFNTNNVTAILARTFNNCTSLITVNLPNVVSITGYLCFGYCTSLQTVNAPKVSTIVSGSGVTTGCFSWASALRIVNLGSVGYPVTTLDSGVFYKQTSPDLVINVYTTGGAPLANQPWGATNATINYFAA